MAMLSNLRTLNDYVPEFMLVIRNFEDHIAGPY